MHRPEQNTSGFFVPFLGTENIDERQVLESLNLITAITGTILSNLSKSSNSTIEVAILFYP